MKNLRTCSELAMNKFLFKPVKQIELLNLFNRGSNRLSSGLDLTVSGWGWMWARAWAELGKTNIAL